MRSQSHKVLVIPGPVEVRPEILDAQAQWMIGHRSTAFSELFARLQEKLRAVFLTENRVFISGSSGTGLWEGASRNCIRDGRKVLHLSGGAFSARWADVSRLNGKDADVIEVPWGQAHTPEMVEDALRREHYDAVCVVHNETSTGVTNPIQAISEVVHRYDDTLLLVDTVSSFLGAELRVDDWGIDMALTSSQKAFALPPGMALATCSPRILERAKEVTNRGYYFDFLELEASAKKNNTPSTPPISLMFAADAQLDAIAAEGLENRWTRHLMMRDLTMQWTDAAGLSMFAPDGYRSPTVSAISNTRGFDVDAMAKFMGGKGYSMDKGYGQIKGKTFRIAHMGDMEIGTLEAVFEGLDEFVASL